MTRRNRSLLIAGSALLVLAAIWSAAWFVVSGRIAAGAEAWAQSERAAGAEVTLGTVAVTGFPLHWQVNLTGAAYRAPPPLGWSWSGPSLRAEIRPWAARTIPLRFDGRHRLRPSPGAEALALEAARPDGTALIGPDGRLAQLALDLGDAVAFEPEAVAGTRIGRLQLEFAPAAASAAIRLTLDDVALTRPLLAGFGQRVAHAAIDASVTGSVPPGPPAAALAAWRDQGGTIEVRHVAVKWDSLDADGDGTVALDNRMRPLGAFALRIRGGGETVDALVTAGVIRANAGLALKLALTALSQPPAPGAPAAGARVPISIQDGRVTVAGFSVATVQPLRLD